MEIALKLAVAVAAWLLVTGSGAMADPGTPAKPAQAAKPVDPKDAEIATLSARLRQISTLYAEMRQQRNSLAASYYDQVAADDALALMAKQDADRVAAEKAPPHSPPAPPPVKPDAPPAK
jgi:hypothetical protein